MNNYPKIKNAILLCLLLAGIQLFFGMIIGFIIGLLGLGTESTFFGVGTLCGQIMSFAVVIFIGIKKSKNRFNEIFKFNNVSFDLWIVVIIFTIGLVLILTEIDNIFNYFLPMPEFLKGTFETIMVKQIFVISIILIVIVPAFTEEMFFRGILLTGFNENYSERKSIIISSLLFGIIHLNPWQFLPAFIIGLFSAWIFVRTKSIWLSIYIHLFNNLSAVILLKYRDILPIKGLNSYSSPEKEFMPIWLDVIGIIFFVVGIILLRDRIKKAKNVA